MNVFTTSWELGPVSLVSDGSNIFLRIWSSGWWVRIDYV